jgi:UDP-N-acetylmuramoyl-L-alanyl-D-glutamate--2,6-diaminopimelate ligase
VSSAALRPDAAPEVALDQLVALLARRGDVRAPAAAPVIISGVTLDSRQVRPGDLYAALPGARVHGAAFAEQAVGAGAAAVLTDPAGAALMGHGLGAAAVPVVAVADPRAALGAVAAAIYGDPTRHLTLLGVTGTNGKTTVAYLLEAGLAAAGHRTGLVGTVQTRIADAVVPSVRTTPEAPELQALFATMRERGVDAAAMEVSSHALALHRVDGCRFAGAAFTR